MWGTFNIVHSGRTDKKEKPRQEEKRDFDKRKEKEDKTKKLLFLNTLKECMGKWCMPVGTIRNGTPLQPTAQIHLKIIVCTKQDINLNLSWLCTSLWMGVVGCNEWVSHQSTHKWWHTANTTLFWGFLCCFFLSFSHSGAMLVAVPYPCLIDTRQQCIGKDKSRRRAM